MAAEDVTARLRTTGEAGFKRAVDGAARSVRSVGEQADRADRRARRAAGGFRLFGSVASSSTRGMRVMSGAAVTGAAAGGLALGMFAKTAIGAASDVNESTTKNQVLFGRYADTVADFAGRSASTLGISRRAALESTGTFGNLFTALEIGPKRSADMSVSLTKLAADLASFNNASPEEALEAIRSGLVGETEPLRRFGVNLSDAALRTEALNQHLVKNTKHVLTPQQKALAVNTLLFRQTSKAQGDFHRTSQGLANQQRILKARWDDVTSSMGRAFLPAALSVVGTVNREVMPALDHFGSALGKVWGEGAKPQTFAERMKATGASAQHWLLDPLEAKARTFWADNREAIITGAESAVSDAGGRMADAAAAAAPHAASMFVSAFKSAGPWGQVLTVGLVASKLGVFSTLGRMAAGRMCGSITSRLPGCLEGGMAGKGAKAGLGRWALALGRIAGPIAAAVIAAEVVNELSSKEPGKRAESANPEGVRAHHVVKPGEGLTGAEIAANRDPQLDPGRSRRGRQIGPDPIIVLPRQSVRPAARATGVTPPRPGAILRVESTVKVGQRELGRATRDVAVGDLARKGAKRGG